MGPESPCYPKAIHIYCLRFHPLVCPLFTLSPVKTAGARSFIFGTMVGLPGKLLIFYESRSKVKCQGQKSGKIVFFQQFLATGSVFPSTGRMRFGSIGRMPRFLGTLPKVIKRQGMHFRLIL